jgi:hypothetical protein
MMINNTPFCRELYGKFDSFCENEKYWKEKTGIIKNWGKTGHAHFSFVTA